LLSGINYPKKNINQNNIGKPSRPEDLSSIGGCGSQGSYLDGNGAEIFAPQIIGDTTKNTYRGMGKNSSVVSKMSGVETRHGQSNSLGPTTSTKMSAE